MVRQFSALLGLLLVATACGATGQGAASVEPIATTQPASSTTRASVEPTTTIRTVSPTTASTTTTAADCHPDLFEYPPVDLEAVEYMTPLGLMTGAHVTPADHQYFQNFKEPDRHIDAYAPADGRVTSIQHFGVPVGEDKTGLVDDFRIEVRHTCTVSSTFMHVTELNSELMTHDPGIGQATPVDVAVRAGETLGWFVKNVDYNIVDLDYVTDGLIEPSTYEREPWKIHVPDTLDYFVPEISEKIASLSLRTAEPRGGVFTYDIDGRLVGNWFEEGTHGYGGVDQNRYWAGHLAIVYNHIDPSMIEVSIGTFNGRAEQLAVTGNSPDPASVSVDTGAVLYELVDWDYWVGDQRWDRLTMATDISARPGSYVLGSILVQLIDDDTLKMELFPGLKASEVSDFTSAAKVFTR